MKCPYCGHEMEQGEILSTHGAFWYPDDGNAPLFWLTKRGLLKKGGFPLWDDWSWAYRRYPAWTCRSCGKLVADIPSDNEKTLD